MMAQGVRNLSAGRKVGVERAGHYRWLRESLFSVFIDNIPGDKDAFWLRKLFDSVGKTRDVFIPFKERSVTKSRFGFVRFNELEEAQEAIRRWNGSVFGRSRLLVKLADCGGKPRYGLKVKGDGQQERSPVAFGRPVQLLDSGIVASKDDSVQQTARKRKVSLEVIPENEEWLLRSAVAELKVFIPPSQLEEELKLNGLKFHKIFPYGGKKMLIHFSSMDDLEDCLSGSFSALSRRFSSIVRWKEEAPSRLRSVWLSIIGLPFKAWSETNLQKIVKPFGYFLKMELKDFQESGLERARVLVETKRLDRIYEVFDAVVGDNVVEAVICEECFFNGREMEWKVEELTDEGEKELVECSLIEGLSCKGRQQCVAEQGGECDRVLLQGGVREWATDGDLSSRDSGAAKSISPGPGSRVSLEAFQSVPGPTIGVVAPVSRGASVDKDPGKSLSFREVVESSWDATLSSFLQRKVLGSGGLEPEVQRGLGSRLPCPREEGLGFEQVLGNCDVSVHSFQVEDAAVDVISQEEDFVRRLDSVEGASRRLVTQKMSSASDLDASAHLPLKEVKRKEAKEKGASKYQRRKERAELDRLKKSYIEVLKKSKKPIQMSEEERRLELERGDVDDEERKLIQRKEAESDEERRKVKQRKDAEETLHFAGRVGIKFIGTEEEGIQFFINQDEERRKEREKEKKERDRSRVC